MPCQPQALASSRRSCLSLSLPALCSVVEERWKAERAARRAAAPKLAKDLAVAEQMQRLSIEIYKDSVPDEGMLFRWCVGCPMHVRPLGFRSSFGHSECPSFILFPRGG
jgi:hypothetical protein